MVPPDIRASDDDREHVAAILRQAHVEGRLTQEEFVQRLDASYSARTYGELEPLVADLPRDKPAREPVGRPSAPAPRLPVAAPPRRGGRALRAAWALWAIAVSVNMVVWLLVSIGNGDLQYFWPMWVAGPWGAVLLVLTVLRGKD